MHFDPEIHRIVPPRGHAIVEVDDHVPASTIIWLYEKSPGFVTGLVVDKARDVTEVKVGDRVIVEMMSGHPAMSLAVSELFEKRTIVVPCRRLPSPSRSEEFAVRQARLRWLQKGKPGVYPPKPLTRAEKVEMYFHECALAEIKESRTRCGRDRLFKPFEDKAQIEGIIAVIEDEPSD